MKVGRSQAFFSKSQRVIALVFFVCIFSSYGAMVVEVIFRVPMSLLRVVLVFIFDRFSIDCAL